MAINYVNKDLELRCRGQYQEALQTYNQLLALQPDDADLLNEKGVALRYLKRYEEALQAFNQSLALQPNDVITLNNKGIVLYDLKRYEEALQAYNQSLALQPNHASMLHNKGLVLHDLKRYEEALQAFNQSLALRPNHANTLDNKGIVLHDLKRYEEALQAFNQSLVLQPDNPAILHNKGIVLHDLKRNEEALQASNQSLALRPNHAGTLDNKGIVLHDLKRYEEALQAFNQSLVLQPNNPATLHNKGIVLHDLKRYEEALQVLNQSLALRPNDAETLHDKGLVLHELEQYKEAVDAFTQALRIDPKHKEAMTHRNEVLALLKKSEKPAEISLVVHHTYDNRPTIPIQFRYDSRTISCEGLIDSGATKTLFPAKYARQLGIDLTNAPTMNFIGIKPGKDAMIVGYGATVEIGVQNEFYKALVYFSDGLDERDAGLLGQHSFFDRFVVEFDKSNKRVTITDKVQKSVKDASTESIKAPQGESVLGVDATANERVRIKRDTRRQGLLVVGATGSGKSGLLENLIVTDIVQGNVGVCLLDPHGDLTNKVIARIPQKRIENGDVIVLNIADKEHPFGLNLFANQNPDEKLGDDYAESKVMHVFKRLWGKGGVVVEDAWGVLLEEILRNSTKTFVEVGMKTPYTMAEIPLLLEDEKFREKLVSVIRNRYVRNYWLNWYNKLNSRDQQQERRSTLNRVNSFLTRSIVENIVGQAKTTINFREIMDQGKVLLVQLDQGIEDVTALICTMIVAELWSAADSRKRSTKRRQFHVYADEFQLYATEDFAKLVKETRKYGVCCTLATQTIAQFEGEMHTALSQIPNVIAFQVSTEDADLIAGKFTLDLSSPETRLEEIRTPASDVLGHLKNRGGHRNQFVNEFVHKYNLLDIPEYDFLFSRVNRGVPFDSLIQTEEEKALLFTMARQQVYAAVREKLAIPFSLFRYREKMFYRDYTDTNPDQYMKANEDWYKLSQFYLSVFQFVNFERERAYHNGWNEYIKDYTAYRSSYDITNDPTKEFIYELFTAAVNPQGVAFQHATNKLEQFIRPLFVKQRGYHYNVVSSIITEMISTQKYARLHPDATIGLVVERYNNILNELAKQFPIINKGAWDWWIDGKKCQALAEREADNLISQQKTLIEQFFIDLQKVLHILTTDPILAGSGSYELKVQPDSPKNAKDRIANELANLPNYHAKVRMVVEEKDGEKPTQKKVEHNIETLAPDRGIGGKELQVRIDQIRDSNIQAGYLRRSREEVQDEIIARQNYLHEKPDGQDYSPDRPF